MDINMTQKEIIEGSKLIAEYLGWKYIPSNDLQGYSKAGWWRVICMEREGGIAEYVSEQSKNHKSKIGARNYICRNHTELRFWNSLDALIPVIKKIEKDSKSAVCLYNNGCTFSLGDFFDDSRDEIRSFDLPNWSNNVFKVIVEYLKQNKNGIKSNTES